MEIPEFGVCLLKIFYQMMNIVKFMAKAIIEQSERPVWMEKRTDHSHTMVAAPKHLSPNQDKLNTPRRVKESFRLKEMTAHMFKNLQQEVRILEKENQESMDSMESTLEVDLFTFRKSQKAGRSYRKSTLPRARHC